MSNMNQDITSSSYFTDNQLQEKSAVSFTPFQDELELHLAKIWRNVLGVKSVGRQQDFFDLGGTSLLAVQLFAEIDKAFKTNLHSSVIFEMSTIEELASFIRVEGCTKMPDTSIVPIKTTGDKPPLFFVNSIGYVRKLAPYLQPDQPFYALNIFGLTNFFKNKLSHLRIEDVAAKFIEDMEIIQPEGPYFLSTYCGDSFVTFEIAQQLQAKGQKVEMLAFIDSIWEPVDLGLSLYLHNIGQFGLDYILEKGSDRLKFIKYRLGLNIEQIKGKLFSKNGQVVPRHIDDINLLKAFQAARASYIPQVYPGNITLFISREWLLRNSPKLASLAAGGAEILELPRYHHTLFQEPQVQVIAEKLKDCIDKGLSKNQLLQKKQDTVAISS